MDNTCNDYGVGLRRVDLCTDSPIPLPLEREAAECSNEEPPLPPMCQYQDNIYIDADYDGKFTKGKDLMTNLEGQPIASEVSDERGVNWQAPYIIGKSLPACFYASIPAYFSDSEAVRNRIWPRRFTVITSDRHEEALGLNFIREFGARLMTVANTQGYRELLSDFVNGVWIPRMRSSNPFLWAIPLGLGLVDDRRVTSVSCDDVGGCAIVGHTTDGQIGKIGFVFNKETLREDARKRFVVVIHTDLFRFSYYYYYKRDLTAFVDKIVGKYKLPEGHVLWIIPPLSEGAILGGLRELTRRMPSDVKAEVMVIFAGHGDTRFETSISEMPIPTTGDRFFVESKWEAILDDRFLRDDIIISDTEFRDVLSRGLPADKVGSVLLLVNSCYSGALVEDEIRGGSY